MRTDRVRQFSTPTDPVVTYLKAETYQNAPNRPTHGYSGPLKVSYGGKRTNVGEDYLATVSKYDKTRVVVDDANRMVDDVNRHEVWLRLLFPSHISDRTLTLSWHTPPSFGRSGSTGIRATGPT